MSGSAGGVVPAPDGTRARDVLRVGEFRALLASSALSMLGDQVARIAVALLVYHRTGSSLAAAATYACSYLTWLVGGLVLSTLGDRLPRRRLMVVCDLLRAAAVAVLVLPRTPLWLVFTVLVVVGVLSPPFDAAKSAVLPEVLTGDAYVVASGIQSSLFQAANAVGFLVGGAVVALTSARVALGLDAGTFLVSGALLAAYVRERPLPARDGQPTLLADTRAGIDLVAHDKELRRLLGFGLLGALVLISPEGLAVPVAGSLRHGAGGQAWVAGVLTAAAPTGFLLGSLLLLRRPPATRLALLPWLVVVSGLALLLTAAVRGTAATGLLWLVAGAGSALVLVANAAYMQAVPAAMRARAFGVASTALMVVQGVLLLVLGALSEIVSAPVVVASAGAVALLVVLPLVPGRAVRAPGTARAARRPPLGTG